MSWFLANAAPGDTLAALEDIAERALGCHRLDVNSVATLALTWREARGWDPAPKLHNLSLGLIGRVAEAVAAGGSGAERARAGQLMAAVAGACIQVGRRYH